MKNNSYLLKAVELGYKVDKGVVSYNGSTLKSILSKKGYYIFSVRIESKPKTVLIHRLVAYQKYGDVIFQKEVEVRHLDGNKLNNLESNIVIGSHSDNMMDRLVQDRINHAILASKHIQLYKHSEVINFYNECKSYKKTMEKFGITSKGTLHYILNKSIEVKL